MKTISTRFFEIPRGEHRVPYKFSVHTGEDGSVQVSRCSAYDETEYHWASKSAGQNHWRIIRNGRTVSTVGAFLKGKPARSTDPLTPEQISYFLIKADQDAHLEPRICHN